MLGQRRRRRPNINPTLPLCIASAGPCSQEVPKDHPPAFTASLSNSTELITTANISLPLSLLDQGSTAGRRCQAGHAHIPRAGAHGLVTSRSTVGLEMSPEMSAAWAVQMVSLSSYQKGRICHFLKWQIRPFKAKVSKTRFSKHPENYTTVEPSL